MNGLPARKMRSARTRSSPELIVANKSGAPRNIRGAFFVSPLGAARILSTSLTVRLRSVRVQEEALSVPERQEHVALSRLYCVGPRVEWLLCWFLVLGSWCWMLLDDRMWVMSSW